MTLYWFEYPNDLITSIPHSGNYQMWKNRLSAQQLTDIRAEFDRIIAEHSNSGKEILTSNWLPSELCPDGGHEWSGTPFWPIYETACGQSWQQAGWCFGLLLWEYMMDRDDEWICGKFDKDGVPIGGTTYFRKTNPYGASGSEQLADRPPIPVSQAHTYEIKRIDSDSRFRKADPGTFSLNR